MKPLDEHVGKSSLSTNGVRAAAYPRTEKCQTPTSHNTQKLTKWITDLKVGNKMLKPLKENTGVNFHDLGLDNGFLHSTLQA